MNKWERGDLNFRKATETFGLSPATRPPAEYHTNLDHPPFIKQASLFKDFVNSLF